MKFTIKPTNHTISIILFLLILFSGQLLSAQQLAFPSAYGSGAYITGGRGGTVIHVTNLNDSGPGSLREALEGSQETRYIVFDVSGVIQLQSKIQVIASLDIPETERGVGNFTVNGFSAPLGGITIIGYPIVHRNIKNYIYRGVRFRNGYKDQVSGERSNQTGLSNGSCIDFIIDRCSIAYAKGMVTGGGSPMEDNSVGKVTFQNNLFGDSDRGILCGNQGTQEVSDISALRNVYSDVRYRTPNSAGEVKLDVINNFIHNWSTRTTRVNGWDSSINMIGNYYQAGEATRLSDRSDKAFIGITTNATMNPQIWDEDNFIDADASPAGYPENPENAWYQFPDSSTSPDPVKSEWFVNSRLPIQGRIIPILLSSQLKTELFPKVGACEYIDNNGSVQYYRDVLDTELIAKAENDQEIDYVAQDAYEALAEDLVNTMPSETRPDDFYVNNPHIPEIWFSANVPAGQDHNDIAPSGYTWLEEYLNQVDGPSSAIGVESITVTPAIAELLITDTLQLTATFTPDNATNLNGIWSSSDESIATVDANGVVTPVSEGVVTITFTTNDGGFSDTSEITVFPEALNPSAGDDQQICEGESTTLIASGGSIYIWNTGETTDSIEVTPNTTTTYTVTVSDDNGQSEEANVTVTVNALPVANAGEDQSLCEGNSTILTATGGTTYLWNTGETTASVEVSPTAETTYSVEVSDNNCSSSDSVTIFVNAAPEIIISENVVIIEGESTTLTVSGSDTYEWNTGETTDSITVTPLTTTTYTVSSIGPNGCLSNAEVIVTVIPEIIANAGNDETICSGETITLTALGGSNYTWNTGDLGSELTVTPTETTIYTVTAEDDYGYTDIDEVTVFVNEVPNITVSDDVFIMIGSSTTLTANGGNTYTWNTGETTSEIIVSPDVTTTYNVTGFSENGCQSIEEVTVNVVEELVANAGEDVSICLGESVTLNASGGITYTWNTGETGATPTFTPTENTTYIVTVTDGFGNSDTDDVTITVNPVPIANAGEDQTLCQSESAVLTAEGGDTYLWSTGETTDTIIVNPNVDTIYTVEAFTASCSDTDEVNVFVLPTPELTVSDDIVIVIGNSTSLEVSGANSYLWSTGEISNSIIVNPTETTIYSVTGYSESGCDSTGEVTVTVIPEINADAGSDTSICNGESVTLTASGGINYSWSTGETSASIIVNPTETETYTVTVSDNFGSSDSDSVTVTVNDLPVITLSQDITIFEGESTDLTVNGANSYLWNTGETTSTIFVSPLETTTYTVTGYSESGCEGTEEITVTVIPEVNANAGSDTSICIGESVMLTASGGTNFSWSTGEISASINISPIETTTYNVTVSDSFGNSDTDSVTVIVNELPSLTLSNDITIFEGESTILSVSGTETYQWNTGETSSTINVSPAETTTYSVTGFSASGCQVTEETTVNVVPEVTANAGNDVVICIGESVTLNATGGSNYTWNTGVTNASITISPTETITYSVTVSDDLGNSDTDSVTVTVNELPNISVSENITIVEGESTSLSVSGAETYLWNTGVTSSSISVSPTQTTTYNVIGITNTCSSELKEVTVTVTPLFRASAGTDERVCDNQNYEVILTANQGDSYLWSTGETTQSIAVSPLSTATYSVTVTLGEQIDTDDVMVYVDPSPDVVVANGDSVEILNGDFITLSASGANTYQWNNGATQPNIAVSPSTTTTYEVKGFIGECYDDKQVTVNVLQPVVADAGDDVLICLDDLTTLTASGGDDYVWNTGETTPTITVSPLETTDYTVTVFNALDFDEATVRVEVDINCAVDSVSPSEEETEFDFDVYPNPASDIVNVKISGTLNVSDINIYDVTGKLIKHSKITNENLSYTTTTQISISTLQSGVYFVKLIDEDRVITKKLIVE